MSDTTTEPKPVEETAAAEAEAPTETKPAEPEVTKAEEEPTAEGGESAVADKEEQDSSSKEEDTAVAAAEATDDKSGDATGQEAETADAAPEPEPEPIEIPSGNGELVLVTGATGYLASHIVKLLVEGGEYRVRGTVRSLENNEKLDALKSLLENAENAKYAPEFVEADLMKPESWADAVKGCEYVLHVASPFPSTKPTDPSEVIDPAKEGTLSVLKACADSGTVKRVVITSSCVAIYSGRPVVKEMLTEDDWADVPKTPTPYSQSKTIAEQAAWEFMKELPESSSMELSVVNPGLITGPPLMKMDCTSIEIVKKLMHRELPMLPKLSFPIIDVRDVALAHLRAMVIKQAAGKRHIVTTSTYWMKDIANYLSQEFNSKGFNVTTTQAPYVLIWFQSHFNTDVKQLLPEIGKIYHFDNTRMRNVLQIEPKAAKESVVEMAHSLINFGTVQKVEKQEKKARKLTFRRKKGVKEEGEEKKDEPEKIKDNGSAENEPELAGETNPEEIQVEINGTENTEEAAPTPADDAAEEEKEEVAPAAAMEDPDKIEAVSSEEEVKEEKPDPESSKSKEKSKKEKKKGGIFSAFSFKSKSKKPVEKKVEEKPAEEAPAAEEGKESDDTPAATEETPVATEEAPAATEEAPAAIEEAPAATEEAPATTEEAPAATEETPAAPEETPAATEEVPAATEQTTPAAADTPTAVEDSTTEPTAKDDPPVAE